LSQDLERKPLDSLQPLFDRARNGDKGARWDLVQLFEPLILSVAIRRIDSSGYRRRTNDDSIDEIRFQTLVTVHEKFDRFEGELHQFPKWIRTIVWRTGSRVLEQRTAMDHRHVPLSGPVGAGLAIPEPHEQVEDRLEVETLKLCMAKLADANPELVDLLRLHYREGRSSEEISNIARHSLDSSGIRRKIRRAREYLRRCLEAGGELR
jgi:RNA polymerase sigma factor (sigma-70 family)